MALLNVQFKNFDKREFSRDICQFLKWKMNLALCCSSCQVLSMFVLFGCFYAYFPIPFSIGDGLASRLNLKVCVVFLMEEIVSTAVCQRLIKNKILKFTKKLEH